MTRLRAPLAELIGTFFLCFAGIAAILSNTSAVGAGLGIVGIALAHGLALSIAVNCFGGVSGGHHNPAVTSAMLVTGRISLPNALIYIVFQCAGAALAAFICLHVFPPAAVAQANLGIPLPAEWVTPRTLFVMEAVMTALLVFAVFGTAVDERGKAVKIGGFGIGLTVCFDILAGGAVTGASMNPARSFGPALIAGNWHCHLYYWAAPVTGAIIAGLIYHHLILEKK
jgi:aquaporin Z